MNHKWPLRILGTLLARNILLNLIGQAMPLLVGGSYHPLYHAGLGRSALVRRVQDGEGEV